MNESIEKNFYDEIKELIKVDENDISLCAFGCVYLNDKNKCNLFFVKLWNKWDDNKRCDSCLEYFKG
jgi:hypothetical protein